jgi:Tol biopolymer transport system component
MSGKGRLVIAICVLACVVTAVLAQEKPEREVSEKLIGKIDVSEITGDSLRVSSDAKHLAYVASSGSKQWVVVDGKKGKEHKKAVGEVGESIGVVFFSPDGKRVVYSVCETMGSKDGWEEDPKTPGKRIYVTKRWGKMCVIVDGKEGEKYDIVKYVTFSPDSKHIAYVAGRDGKEFIVVDDKEEKQQYDSVRWPEFSPDSKRLAYSASVEREKEPLGTTFEKFVVVDGKEGEHYGGEDVWVRPVVFSPDSKRVAYSIRALFEKEFIVVDGVPEKVYEDVGECPAFSPDSKHIAYSATDRYSYKKLIILDGKEQEVHDYVITDWGIVGVGIIFSPDSKRLAYTASAYKERKMLVVVDGKEGKRYDHVMDVVFSPDSKRLAYYAHADEKYLVVVDADEGKRYDGVSGPVFSPDSKSVAYLAKRGDKWFVVVNGTEGKQYDSVLGVTFDSDNALHYLALSGNAVYLVEEKLK